MDEESHMPVTPSQAGPRWPGWDDVIKTHWQMCGDKAGEAAFAKYMKSLISPRSWGLDTALDIAMKLRNPVHLGNHGYPYAFPLGDIIIALNGCPGPRLAKDHTGTRITENQLGARLRAAGCLVHYPTRHLDGAYSAPGSARGNAAVVLSKTLSAVRTAADYLEELDPLEVAADLDDDMRNQLGAFADDVLTRASRARQFLKENS